MLQPVRTKWRKAHKGRIHGNATRANFINYGAYALWKDKVEFGQEYFLIYQSQKNQSRYEWVKERVHQNIMLAE